MSGSAAPEDTTDSERHRQPELSRIHDGRQEG